ncbi:hypothetical protein [Streptomyces barringtoniae]|uniref:hypothetical protein n=1 Tax=Streptomyces barringtoniae TaxID=2892029 RepID=UPI001E4EFCAA|nr:hypothetical protein [Streptomyces barringtoniae]MCC5480007.1 hypothetical protein [Streptomyces barringtoniae]
MSTSQTAFKKALSRIGAVGAVLGVALAAGTATAASAVAAAPATHLTAKAAAPAGGHDEHGGSGGHDEHRGSGGHHDSDDDDGGCEGLIVLLCN